MRKFSLYIIGLVLFSSSTLPFISSTVAEAKTDNTLELSSNGSKNLQIEPSEKDFKITLKNTTNKQAKIELPKGLTYKEDLKEIIYEKDTNILVLKASIKQMDIPLALSDEKSKNNFFTLLATTNESNETVTSNEFIIMIASDFEEEAVVNTKKDLSNDNIVANTKPESKEKTAAELEKSSELLKAVEIAKNAKKTKTKKTVSPIIPPENQSNKLNKTTKAGMTTKPGVPKAPTPAVITTAKGTNEVNVSTWNEFTAALNKPNITAIHVQNDFYDTATDSNKNTVISPNHSPNLTINGNGHTIDFRNARINLKGDNDISTLLLTINNLTFYSANEQGLFAFNIDEPRFLLNDVTFIGTAINTVLNLNISFAGKIENHVVNSYVSPFGTNITYNINLDTIMPSVNVLTIQENSTYNASTDGTLSFYIMEALVIEKNASVTMTGGQKKQIISFPLLYLRSPNLNLNENATLDLNLTAAHQQSAINFAAIYSSLEVNLKKNSSLTIHANQENLACTKETMDLTMDNPNFQNCHVINNESLQGSIDIEDSAALNIETKTAGGGVGNFLNLSRGNSLILDENATLNLVSASTKTNALINFPTDSSMTWNNSKKINLEFTNKNIDKDSRLFISKYSSFSMRKGLEIQGWTFEDMHKEQTFYWPAINSYSMYDDYLNINAQSEVTNASFKKNFNSDNFSRLLYTKVEGTQLDITNEPNDNVTSTDSQVIKGVTTPNSYVRVTGDTALPEPSITSPAKDSINENVAANYSVMADSDGKFEVHAKKDQHFSVNELKIYSYLNDKSQKMTKDVLDKTAPTAESIRLSGVRYTKIPPVEAFLKNVQDSNPKNKGFTYTFKEDYSNIIKTLGVHEIIIILADDAGNETEITTSIEIFESSVVLYAEDFVVHLSELRKYDTPEKLKDFLLSESKATAKKIVNNQLVDTTDEIRLKSTDNIEELKNFIYSIEISMEDKPGYETSKLFNARVLNDEAVKPTYPTWPGNTPSPDPIEKENEGTGQSGLLKLDYAPSRFEFGTVTLGNDTMIKNAIKTTSTEQWLQVSDHRHPRSYGDLNEPLDDWSIQVNQTSELTSPEGKVLRGATITIPKGRMYTENTGKNDDKSPNTHSSLVEVSSEPQMIYAKKNITTFQGTSTKVWNAQDVTLSIPASYDNEPGNYSNTIVWTLVVEP